MYVKYSCSAEDDLHFVLPLIFWNTCGVSTQKRRGGWPKGRKRKPELPVVKPPKAPLTAYVLFLNERRKYYKETRPDLRFGAVSGRHGLIVKWNVL